MNFVVDEDIEVGEKVVVESERGITVGDVKKKVIVEDENIVKDFPGIIRIATHKDLIFMETKKELEEEARKYCLERIEYRNMKMKIVDVKYMLHSSKIIFYFTADGRVDFRALVKDLASKLKSRIEMRQIGVRDQAQMVGGIGICGRELCCHTFMNTFLPVSLEDAKLSSSGNSDKLIGVCGRFMCCLKFEDNEACENCDKNPKNTEDFPVEEIAGEIPEENILNIIPFKEKEPENRGKRENVDKFESKNNKEKKDYSKNKNGKNFNYRNRNKRNNTASQKNGQRKKFRKDSKPKKKTYSKNKNNKNFKEV